jgi:hypothetical protein
MVINPLKKPSGNPTWLENPSLIFPMKPQDKTVELPLGLPGSPIRYPKIFGFVVAYPLVI